MKKIAIAITICLGLLSGQVAQAWEWPFFGSNKNEAPLNAPIDPAQVLPPEAAADEAGAKNDIAPKNDFLTEERLKFVARSYARSFNLPGDETEIEFNGRLVKDSGQMAGLAFQPTDFSTFYVGAVASRRTAAGPFADLLGDFTRISSGWTAGADVKVADVTAGLKYFDFKSQPAQPSPLKANQDNIASAGDEENRAKGLEFSASWAMDQTFDWGFSLRPYVSFARFLERSGGSRLDRADSDFRFSWGLIFSYEEMGLTMSVVANDLNRRSPFPYALAGEDIYSSAVYDFHLIKRLYVWDKSRLSLKADVTNIGGAPVNGRRDKNEEGRTFKTGLRYEY
jgi:hypothetical protein